MQEQKNLSREEVLEMKDTFPIEPSFSKVVVTINTEDADGMLVLSENTMSEEQYIVSKGPNVLGYEVGERVAIDLEKLMTKEPNPNNTHEYITRIKLDPIYIGDQIYALIEDRFIKYKYRF